MQQSYSPMTIRFFILQAHYGGTLDFSNEALIAAEKGMKKLFAAYALIEKLKPNNANNESLTAIYQNCLDAMDDDFNSPIVIANLFEAARIANSANDRTILLSRENITTLKDIFDDFLFNILGMNLIEENTNQNSLDNELMAVIIELRKNAKQNKDYASADTIRYMLAKIGISLKDTKDGVEWTVG